MRYISSMPDYEAARWRSAVESARAAKDKKRLQELLFIGEQYRLPHLTDWCMEFLPHYFKLPPSKMHDAITDSLHQFVKPRDTGLKEAVIAPRSGAKTTWCSKSFPLYCICHNLEKYMLLVGDTTGQAQQNLESIKSELETNTKLAAAYPHACGIGSVWNVDQIVTRNEIKVQALGAGMKFRGRSFHEHRPGLIVTDDLDNDDLVLSEEQREKMWKWFARVLIPMGSESTHFLFVQTALHEDDTIHRVRKTGEWEWRRFQALIKEPVNDELWNKWKTLFLDMEKPKAERQAAALDFYNRNKDEMDRGAQLLWPEKESLYALMSYRTAYGESAFQSEKQGFPMSDQATEWPPEVFRDTSEHRLSFSQWPDTRLRVISLDPSKGKTDSSDFSAFILLGLGTDGLLYVDADVKRRDTTRIVEDGFVLAERFKPDMFIVETNQYQELLATEFNRVAAERGVVLPLSGFNNTLKKQVRIRRIGPYLQMHKLRFRSESSGVDELLKQLRQFPQGKHDDAPDALDMAIEGLKHLLSNTDETVSEEEIWNA